MSNLSSSFLISFLPFGQSHFNALMYLQFSDQSLFAPSDTSSVYDLH